MKHHTWDQTGRLILAKNKGHDSKDRWHPRKQCLTYVSIDPFDHTKFTYLVLVNKNSTRNLRNIYIFSLNWISDSYVYLQQCYAFNLLLREFLFNFSRIRYTTIVMLFLPIQESLTNVRLANSQRLRIWNFCRYS